MSIIIIKWTKQVKEHHSNISMQMTLKVSDRNRIIQGVSKSYTLHTTEPHIAYTQLRQVSRSYLTKRYKNGSLSSCTS